jgi:hypothetical protein
MHLLLGHNAVNVAVEKEYKANFQDTNKKN